MRPAAGNSIGTAAACFWKDRKTNDRRADIDSRSVRSPGFCRTVRRASKKYKRQAAASVAQCKIRQRRRCCLPRDSAIFETPAEDLRRCRYSLNSFPGTRPDYGFNFIVGQGDVVFKETKCPKNREFCPLRHVEKGVVTVVEEVCAQILSGTGAAGLFSSRTGAD